MDDHKHDRGVEVQLALSGPGRGGEAADCETYSDKRSQRHFLVVLDQRKLSKRLPLVITEVPSLGCIKNGH